MLFVLLLSAGLHAQTLTLPTNPPRSQQEDYSKQPDEYGFYRYRCDGYELRWRYQWPNDARACEHAALEQKPNKTIAEKLALQEQHDRELRVEILSLRAEMAKRLNNMEIELDALRAKVEARRESGHFLNAYTVAALPNNVRIGTEVVVTDSWLGGCAIGNGTKHVICVRTADGWEKKLPTFAELTARVETVENLGKWRGWTIADIVKRLEKLEEKKK